MSHVIVLLTPRLAWKYKALSANIAIIISNKNVFPNRLLDLRECLDAAERWTSAATQHLDRTTNLEGGGELTAATQGGEDVFSQIRQLDYLLSRSRELRLRTR
jgi:hypothetical protein